MNANATRRSSTKGSGKSRKKIAPAPKWQPASQALASAFEQVVKTLPGTENRKMFGCPAVFGNGHMFAGVFQSTVFVRLGQATRRHLLETRQALPFEPMPGRVMREYVVLPAAIAESQAQLRIWLARGLAYVAGLLPKV